jgi:putative transposase
MPAIKTTYSDEEVLGVRLVPYGDRYNYEILHEQPVEDLGLDKDRSIGIDLGLTNTATTSDGKIVKGGALKSINQYYNKELARSRSVAEKVNGVAMTRKVKRITRIRNNKVHDEMHNTSSDIIDHCISQDIGTIYIGYNPGWKVGARLGKRTNQQFVQVPFLHLAKQLEYKAALAGIEVHRVTEEYTSQTCSRCGQRRKANRASRGLYKCKQCGLIINADVNAARNIKQKGFRETPRVVEAVDGVVDRGGLDPPVEIKVAT